MRAAAQLLGRRERQVWRLKAFRAEGAAGLVSKKRGRPNNRRTAASVHGFAQQSGGEVRIDTRLGQGTTIILYLQRAHEDLPRAVAEGSEAPQDGLATTILVVDDDAEVRDWTARALKVLNYQVLEADNGRVALDLLRDKDAVDLTLIDLVMPGMNGRQFGVPHPGEMIRSRKSC